MLTSDGPRVVEFNVRLGDPEAQVVLPLIESDLSALVAAAASGEFGRSIVCRRSRASHRRGPGLRRLPGHVSDGQADRGLDEAEAVPGVLVFHAGTARRDGEIVTDGGRVLTVVGRGVSFAEAIDRAYQAAACIRF